MTTVEALFPLTLAAFLGTVANTTKSVRAQHAMQAAAATGERAPRFSKEALPPRAPDGKRLVFTKLQSQVGECLQKLHNAAEVAEKEGRVPDLARGELPPHPGVSFVAIKVVAMHIASYSGKTPTSVCFASLPTLEDGTNLDESTVREVCKFLESIEMLERFSRVRAADRFQGPKRPASQHRSTVRPIYAIPRPLARTLPPEDLIELITSGPKPAQILLPFDPPESSSVATSHTDATPPAPPSPALPKAPRPALPTPPPAFVAILADGSRVAASVASPTYASELWAAGERAGVPELLRIQGARKGVSLMLVGSAGGEVFSAKRANGVLLHYVTTERAESTAEPVSSLQPLGSWRPKGVTTETDVTLAEHCLSKGCEASGGCGCICGACSAAKRARQLEAKAGAPFVKALPPPASPPLRMPKVDEAFRRVCLEMLSCDRRTPDGAARYQNLARQRDLLEAKRVAKTAEAPGGDPPADTS
jgi:hypothetical protein